MSKPDTIPDPIMCHVSICCLFMLLFSCTIPGKTLSGQALYQLQYPFSTSPYSGAEFHILVHRELSRLDNRFVPSEIFDKEDSWSKTGNIMYRLIRMGTYGFYLAYLPIVNQHEYFGHLARAKQHYAESGRYEIYFFPPTGGRAFYGNPKYTLTDMELGSMYMGGVEANSILAGAIRRNSLLNGRMSFQDAMLYLGSVTDFNTYVLFENNGSFDDVTQHLSVINLHKPEEDRIQREDLVLPSVFSIFLDPFTLQSFANLILQFLINGNTTFKAPSMLQVGRIGLLPYYSFEPSAFGFRHYLNGFLRSYQHLYQICLHKDAFKINDDFGLQVTMYGFSIFRKLLSFDLDLRCWQSGPLAYHISAGVVHNSKVYGALIGGKIYLQLTPEFLKKKNIFFMAGGSLKSPGYTKGYPLTRGLSFNFGIGYASRNL